MDWKLVTKEDRQQAIVIEAQGFFRFFIFFENLFN
jgi:hypothetical protein